MSQIRLCLGTTAQHRSKALKFRIELLLEFSALHNTENYKYRFKKMGTWVSKNLTYSIDSVTLVLAELSFIARLGFLDLCVSEEFSGLEMSMDDDINH